MDGFKVGDRVQLKSGGPAMTVTKCTPDGCICEWFDEKEQPMKRRHVAAALREFKPGSPTSRAGGLPSLKRRVRETYLDTTPLDDLSVFSSP